MDVQSRIQDGTHQVVIEFPHGTTPSKAVGEILIRIARAEKMSPEEAAQFLAMHGLNLADVIDIINGQPGWHAKAILETRQVEILSVGTIPRVGEGSYVDVEWGEAVPPRREEINPRPTPIHG